MRNLNKKCIFRGTSSGVFYGTLVEHKEQEVTIKNCRRIWFWDGANSINQIAVDGVARPENCKFTVAVESITILDCIEIIPCTEKAIECIESVPEWRLLGGK